MAERELKPGLYPDVSMEEYLSWDIASASRIADVSRSPAHARQRIDAPDKSTPAKDLGTAIHMAILEPDLWSKTYRANPPGDGRTASARDARAALAAEGFTLLKEEDFAICERIRTRTWAHPTTKALLSKLEYVEISAIGLIEGIPVKVRADGLTPASAIIMDLKSARDASPDAFGRQVCSLRYHWSAAIYVDVFASLGIPIDYYLWLAVEKEEPNELALYVPPDTVLALARNQYRKHLHTYDACAKSGVWPGYPKEIQSLDLPAWAYKQAAMEEGDDDTGSD